MNESNILMYTTEDGLTKIETTFDGDTVWLSKAQMAELFQRDRSVISKHIKNVFEEGELTRESNVQILHIANSDKPVEFYNLDVIISVLEELQKELLKVANSKGNYDSITDEIYRLREMKQNAMADSAEREGLKLRIDEMRQFLDEQTESITEYDEKLTRRLIEKITVYEDHFTIEFKSGTDMDVHR